MMVSVLKVLVAQSPVHMAHPPHPVVPRVAAARRSGCCASLWQVETAAVWEVQAVWSVLDPLVVDRAQAAAVSFMHRQRESSFWPRFCPSLPKLKNTCWSRPSLWTNPLMLPATRDPLHAVRVCQAVHFTSSHMGRRCPRGKGRRCPRGR